MGRIVHLILFILFLINGCAIAKQESQTFYDPDYSVIDRGELDVKIISRACSDTFEKALSAARKPKIGARDNEKTIGTPIAIVITNTQIKLIGIILRLLYL